MRRSLRSRSRKPRWLLEAAEAEAEAVVDEDEADEQEVAADGAAPAKKKTRRGSRGGRNRKKKPVAGAEGEDEGLADAAEAADVAAEDELDAPRVRARRAPRGSMFPLPTWTARLPSRSHAAAPSRCPRPTKSRPSRPSQATRRAMRKWWSTASSRSRRRPGAARAADATGRRSRSWPAGTATLRKPPRLPSPTRPPSLTKLAQPAAVAAPASEPSRPEPVSDEPKTGSDDYVPMSEWGDEI